MTAYDEVMKNLTKLATATFKNREAYVNHIKGLVVSLEKLSEGYAEVGHNKLAQSVVSVRNKMLTLSRRVESGKTSEVNDIRTSAKEALDSMSLLSPKAAESTKDKAGMERGLGKLFADFKLKRVKLTTDGEGKAFKLEKAPLLLLFKGPLSPVTKKFLKNYRATFYSGTGGVSIPAIPILVLNTDIVPKKDYDRVIKTILKNINRPDLAVFKDQAVVRRNYIAFPVFEPRDAEIVSTMFLRQVRTFEIWVS